MTTGNKFYVVGEGQSPWLLDLRPKSMKDCERAINWQRVGQGQFDRWHICTYDKAQKLFVLHSAPARTFAVDRRPYTVDAFETAQARDFE